jgi:hypothetical protein
LPERFLTGRLAGNGWVEKSVLEGGDVDEVDLVDAVGEGLVLVYLKNLRLISDRFVVLGL